MAYKLETQKITPGGLNLLAPVDQVAGGDCLDLQGFWPNSVGRVEVMPSPTHVSGATAVDSVCDKSGTVYSGASSSGTLYRGGVSVDTGYDAYPLGMISYQGFCWVINRSQQRKDDGSAVTDWTPAASGVPTLTDMGVGGGFFAFPTWYYATAQTPVGESNPSTPVSCTPAVDSSYIRITKPASLPAGATGWNIYRLVGGTAYLLNQEPIPVATTTYDDYGDDAHNQTDTDLLDFGVIMEADHDPAPAARIMANQVYNGRIVVANSAANPNRIWYTPALQPGFFRGSGNGFDGDWVDVGSDAGDEILAISVRPTMCVIYRAKSIWRHVGDFGADDARLEVVVPELGIVGPHAMVQTSVGDFFRGPEGFYRFNMDWAQPISAKITPLFQAGQTPENFTAESLPSLCALGYENGRLWVSYQESIFKASLIYHPETDRWFRAYFGYSAYAPSVNGLLGALTGVDLVPGSTPYNTIAFQPAYLDCGFPDHEKTFADLTLNHLTGGVGLQIEIRLNKNTDAFALEIPGFPLGITSSVPTKQTIPLVYPSTYSTVAMRGLPIRAYNLSVRITGTGVPVGAAIDGPMLLHYYLEARRAKAFDTDETDHGIQGVKECDQLEFDIDTTDGTANMRPYSDLPGGSPVGTMVARTLEGVAQTTGRQSVRLVLTAPIDGKLLRYTMYSSTDFQIYGLRARILPIGCYLDGTVGDFWQPQPISIGV